MSSPIMSSEVVQSKKHPEQEDPEADSRINAIMAKRQKTAEVASTAYAQNAKGFEKLKKELLGKLPAGTKGLAELGDSYMVFSESEIIFNRPVPGEVIHIQTVGGLSPDLVPRCTGFRPDPSAVLPEGQVWRGVNSLDEAGGIPVGQAPYVLFAPGNVASVVVGETEEVTDLSSSATGNTWLLCSSGTSLRGQVSVNLENWLDGQGDTSTNASVVSLHEKVLMSLMVHVYFKVPPNPNQPDLKQYVLHDVFVRAVGVDTGMSKGDFMRNISPALPSCTGSQYSLRRVLFPRAPGDNDSELSTRPCTGRMFAAREPPKAQSNPVWVSIQVTPLPSSLELLSAGVPGTYTVVRSGYPQKGLGKLVDEDMLVGISGRNPIPPWIFPSYIAPQENMLNLGRKGDTVSPWDFEITYIQNGAPVKMDPDDVDPGDWALLQTGLDSDWGFAQNLGNMHSLSDAMVQNKMDEQRAIGGRKRLVISNDSPYSPPTAHDPPGQSPLAQMLRKLASQKTPLNPPAAEKALLFLFRWGANVPGTDVDSDLCRAFCAAWAQCVNAKEYEVAPESVHWFLYWAMVEGVLKKSGRSVTGIISLADLKKVSVNLDSITSMGTKFSKEEFQDTLTDDSNVVMYLPSYPFDKVPESFTGSINDLVQVLLVRWMQALDEEERPKLTEDRVNKLFSTKSLWDIGKLLCDKDPEAFKASVSCIT